MLLLCLYVIGAIITAGTLPNGIRDEMDGIGDLFVVFFWPIVWPIKIVLKGCSLLYKFGTLFRAKK
jgi:hypothetical protein